MADYRVIQDRNNFRTSSSEGPIDREIIDQMTALGIDCRPLAGTLLLGDFTDLTALYRLFIRERMTEKVNDVIQKMKCSARIPVRPPRLLSRPLSLRLPDRKKQHREMADVPVGPPEVVMGPRRSSKPAVAPGKGPAMANIAGVSHETP
jgi:hypothetical protein